MTTTLPRSARGVHERARLVVQREGRQRARRHRAQTALAVGGERAASGGPVTSEPRAPPARQATRRRTASTVTARRATPAGPALGGAAGCCQTGRAPASSNASGSAVFGSVAVPPSTPKSCPTTRSARTREPGDHRSRAAVEQNHAARRRAPRSSTAFSSPGGPGEARHRPDRRGQPGRLRHRGAVGEGCGGSGPVQNLRPGSPAARPRRATSRPRWRGPSRRARPSVHHDVRQQQQRGSERIDQGGAGGAGQPARPGGEQPAAALAEQPDGPAPPRSRRPRRPARARADRRSARCPDRSRARRRRRRRRRGAGPTPGCRPRSGSRNQPGSSGTCGVDVVRDEPGRHQRLQPAAARPRSTARRRPGAGTAGPRAPARRRLGRGRRPIPLPRTWPSRLTDGDATTVAARPAARSSAAGRQAGRRDRRCRSPITLTSAAD